MLIQYSLLVLIAPQRSKCCRESVQSGGLEDESYHGQEPRQECLQDLILGRQWLVRKLLYRMSGQAG
jgi:hypothetical protein